MTSYAVVGASRGIGLEFVRQLASRPNAIVFAIVRNSRTSTHLLSACRGLPNIHIVEADVADYGSLERAAKEVSNITGGTLDCLIHNAALVDSNVVTKGYDDFKDMDELDAECITAFKINTLGTIHSISAFLPLLRSSHAQPKKIITISAAGADHKFVNIARIPHMTGYGLTKAAALVATTKWAVRLKDEGFVVVSLSPGLVDTSRTADKAGDPRVHDMYRRLEEQFEKAGVPLPLQTTEESVSAQLKVIDGLKPSDNGLFLAHTGGEWHV